MRSHAAFSPPRAHSLFSPPVPRDASFVLGGWRDGNEHTIRGWLRRAVLFCVRLCCAAVPWWLGRVVCARGRPQLYVGFTPRATMIVAMTSGQFLIYERIKRRLQIA